MGAVFSKKNYTRLEANTLDQTSFECYTEVSTELRHAKIESATDQTFGSADNLLKSTEVDKDLNNSKQEEFRDGWIVKRHEVQARATVLLCNTSQIYGFDIDTTGFKNTCPTHALIEAFKVSEDKDEEGIWTTLIQEEELKEDAHNFFEMKEDNNVYSRVRLTISPGGGIARFRTYGVIDPKWVDTNKEVNLASANNGARIVRWTDTSNSNKPNVLLDNGTLISHGWLTPRSRKTDRDDFIVIQLSAPGTLNSIVIDTTGFVGNSPNRIHIEGCNTPEDDPYQNVNTFWIPLVPESDIKDDNVETFAITCEDVISHVRVTVLPDGGLQQIKCFGFVMQEDAKQLQYKVPNLITIASDRSCSVDSSEDTFVVEDEDEQTEKPIIDELNICKNNKLSPPPTVKKPASTPIPIEDPDLYVKTVIEELNGSTTQLLTPAVEKSEETLQASPAEIAEMNTSAVEQLQTTDVPVYAPLEDNQEPSDITAIVNETTDIEEITTIIVEEEITLNEDNATGTSVESESMEIISKEEIIINEDTISDASVEPEAMEIISKEEVTVTEKEYKGEKRKSFDAEIEDSEPVLPKKKATRGKAKKVKDVVKEEDVVVSMVDSEVKKGRGRARGRPRK